MQDGSSNVPPTGDLLWRQEPRTRTSWRRGGLWFLSTYYFSSFAVPPPQESQKKNHVLINWRKHRLVCEKILGRLLCNLPITTYSTIKHQTETKSVRKKYHIMGIQKLLPKNINDIFNNLEMLILPKWCIPIHDTFLPTKNKIHLSILWRHISMQVSIA